MKESKVVHLSLQGSPPTWAAQLENLVHEFLKNGWDHHSTVPQGATAYFVFFTRTKT